MLGWEARGNQMIEKLVEVEWDIRLETLNEEYYFQLIPICTVLLIFEDETQKGFSFQVGNKTLIMDYTPGLPINLINKIIDRIEKPLRKQVDDLISGVESLTKYGSFEKEFWDKFWVDNMMNK